MPLEVRNPAVRPRSATAQRERAED
jgi:hypothetical protein